MLTSACCGEFLLGQALTDTAIAQRRADLAELFVNRGTRSLVI